MTIVGKDGHFVRELSSLKEIVEKMVVGCVFFRLWVLSRCFLLTNWANIYIWRGRRADGEQQTKSCVKTKWRVNSGGKGQKPGERSLASSSVYFSWNLFLFIYKNARRLFHTDLLLSKSSVRSLPLPEKRQHKRTLWNPHVSPYRFLISLISSRCWCRLEICLYWKKKRDPRWEKKTRWFIDAVAIFVRGKKFFFCSLHSRFFSAPNSRRGCSFVCWTLIFFLSVTAPSRLLWNNSIGTTPCVGCSCAPTRSPSAAIFRYLHENTNLHERQKDLKKRWKNPDRWRQVCIKCG